MVKKRDKKPVAERRHCPGCGATVDKSDRFCRECGAPLKDDAKANGGLRGLVGLRAFGLAIVALAVFFAVLHYTRSSSRTDEAPGQRISITDVGAPPTAGATVPARTPRENADILFNQAMAAYETGDSTGARQFIPMAIVAYQGLTALDPDARYHLALLNLAADQPQAALAQADTILSQVPNHLLGLSVSARAFDRMGREDMAAEYFRRFLDAYTPDVVASRPEYIDHGKALPDRAELARSYLEAHGQVP
jgi:tetratricopeptide (TPR) repeat protein